MNKWWQAFFQAVGAFVGSILGVNMPFQVIIMAKRKRLTRKGSRRLFKATANKTHIKNIPHLQDRGGIRL